MVLLYVSCVNMGYIYALSWKLLIIGLLSEYIATLLKRQYLKKIAPYFFTDCTFSYGKVKDISLEIMIKFHLGRTKERGKRGVWREKPKNEVLFAKFPLLSKIQTLSHKLFM